MGTSLILAILALFVAAPVVQYAVENSEQFFERTETTSLFNLTPREEWARQLRASLVSHVLMFNVEGDPNPRHNLPNAPMLDRITGALFLLGFFFALVRWRRVALFTLPFWVFLMVLPGVFTVPWEAPQSLRSILVIPAVAALAALVIDLLWRTWREVPWHLVRRIALPAVLALLGIVAYLNVDLYFGDQANDPRVYAAFSTDETLMARSQVEQQRLGYSLWVSRQFLFGLTSTLLANPPEGRGAEGSRDAAARFDAGLEGRSRLLRTTRTWLLGGNEGLLPRRQVQRRNRAHRRRPDVLYRLRQP